MALLGWDGLLSSPAKGGGGLDRTGGVTGTGGRWAWLLKESPWVPPAPGRCNVDDQPFLLDSDAGRGVLLEVVVRIPVGQILR